jgi:hypothetical protein
VEKKMKINESYCKDCSKYFEDEEDLKLHTRISHGGVQSKLGEQTVDMYSDYQNIMIEDQRVSLPPPRKTPNYNEAKTNWEGMWEEDRTTVLQDGNLDTEYASYSFKDIPEDVRDKIYFVLQKYATTRENELSVRDEGDDKPNVDGQFEKFSEEDFSVIASLPVVSMSVDVMKSLEPFIRSKIKRISGEGIPTSCPECKEKFEDMVSYYYHRMDIHDEDVLTAKNKTALMIKSKSKPDVKARSKSFFRSMFESYGPYELSTLNGTLIAQSVPYEVELQDMIDEHQLSRTVNESLVVKDSIGNDVSNMFYDTVHENTINIDKELYQMERELGLL